MNFTTKIVLVAGGTGGLGRAVTLAFLEQRACVYVTYRNEREFAEVKQAAGDREALLAGRQTDVTDETAVESLVAEILAVGGRLDVLVNAVGGYVGGRQAWEYETGDLDRMLALNLRSGWVLGRAAARAMLRNGEGAIVNVASRAALEHNAGAAVYAASKAGALALIDSLAEDLRGTGVRVNSVLPGIIDTEANRKAMPSADFSKWPKTEEIARVILFLASEDAKVIHGAAIPVYGAP
jgi:NAD(P)-dependent dehydrogenase (short-subunit alcohol dehydrogenase family)